MPFGVQKLVASVGNDPVDKSGLANADVLASILEQLPWLNSNQEQLESVQSKARLEALLEACQ